MITDKKTKYQKFEAQDINRKLIRNAPYNPRLIDGEEKKRLKRNLKRVGLLSTLVWNKTTGNLVSGHQRLSILDALEGSPDYTLTVAVVELDEKTEKEQNIFFNSTSAQGRFDFDKLNLVLEGVEWQNAGLSEYDLNVIGFEIPQAVAKSEAAKEVESELTEMFGEIGARHSEEAPDDWERKKELVKQEKQRIAGVNADRASKTDAYVTLSFSTYAAKQHFMQMFGLNPDDLFIKGEAFVKLLEGE